MMDTNEGRFVELDKSENWMERVAVGEIVKIKGEALMIVGIEGRRIELELQSATDRMLLEDEKTMRRELERQSARSGTGFIGGAANRR